MSNGGGKTGRHLEKPSTWKRKSGADDFAQAIAKIAVAQLLESQGFHSFQQSALEALSDVAVRYASSIGRSAHYYANLAGRTESNAFDVIQGLEDLVYVQGFSGASDVDHCLEDSGAVREIVHYVNEVEPIPFVHPVPRFPIVKDRELTPSFSRKGKVPPAEHIPAWLPAFPDPQTYSLDPTVDARGADPHAANGKFDQERENDNGDRSLLSSQQQMVSGMFEKPTFADPDDAKAKKASVEGNPFLAPPLKVGEKEVAPIAPPTKLFNNVTLDNPVARNFLDDKSVSVLETFAPAIEAMKSTSCDSGEDQTTRVLNENPRVRFKIGVGNKFLGRSTGLSPEKEHQRTLPWFAMEDEKDDRKRRAEKILRESLENPDQLVQL
ncbi:hypothetical protein HN51_067842 [Arachis hypogaea]|uniref:transcription initiation factor TFIID subunit 8 n=1 Tax=Arachis ipaensis TaxID=130454 RepID=UPI0007AF5B08|nr:transcription initiation factor TFIID subunit 8 [Arachis ipaensis]XP_016194389.1 transcription initiation factor TFIID subunit 8 [Arachis ipaensis]XP_025650051.1 transcription initiation factor TFIID subunit 8 [Arachis hypogaea]XP_025650052.1 transcription initiation factor TFIID subunit 8 [Arachis hypogaea]QHO09333.1 Transcription initiation factor TFIID subunit [Arachis hypogaea]QHO09334.1 Transcription initiation factor TFIID subunit [Arachis hypogaea]